MALVSQSEVEARLGRALSTEETAAFAPINLAIQVQVEKIIGSSIESVSATTRYYDGDVQNLAIDPCTSVTKVEYVDEYYLNFYTLLSSDYTLEPINRTLKRMVCNRLGLLNAGINNVAVTAKFSIYEDTATLNMVKDAMISAMLVQVENTDNIKKQSIEGYSVEFATTEIKNTLDTVKYLFPEV